jgi:DNA-directed RNA polymerase subunit RPC12/RpoP
MPVSHSPRMIEQSRCPKCEIRMMLVGVEPSFAGPDLRTLECPKCELAYKTLAEERPRKPKSVRICIERRSSSP